MAARVLIAYVILCVLGYGACVNHEYEIELQKRLQTLNKPSVKTIIIKETGDLFDCIAIDKQPAFDHPALKNHKIQLRPTASRLFRNESRKTSVKLRGTREACSDGTVPIKRITKEDLIRSDKEFLATKDQEAPSKKAELSLENQGKLLGSYLEMSLYNLSIGDDQESSTQLRLVAGPPSQADVLAVGWKVSHNLNGDGFTRLFGFWHDGTNNKGCYNNLCPGFVQVDKEISLNYLFTKTSVYGNAEEQYDVFVALDKDPDTGDWWLYAGDDSVKIGYWPKELFPNLANGADLITWGGAASAGANGDYPPMGSGHLPDGFYKDTCFFDNVRYVNSANELHPPRQSETKITIDFPACYDLKFVPPNEALKIIGFSFMFGGPGGKCS